MTRREDNVISSHNQPTHPVPSHPIPIEQSKATHTCSAATRHNATTRGKAQQSKLPLHPSTQQSRPTTNSRLLPAYTNWPPNIPPTFPHFIQLGRTKVVDKRSGMPFKDTKSAPHHRAPSSQGIQGTPPRQEAKRQKDKKKHTPTIQLATPVTHFRRSANQRKTFGARSFPIGQFLPTTRKLRSSDSRLVLVAVPLLETVKTEEAVPPPPPTTTTPTPLPGR